MSKEIGSWKISLVFPIPILLLPDFSFVPTLLLSMCTPFCLHFYSVALSFFLCYLLLFPFASVADNARAYFIIYGTCFRREAKLSLLPRSFASQTMTIFLYISFYIYIIVFVGITTDDGHVSKLISCVC